MGGVLLLDTILQSPTNDVNSRVGIEILPKEVSNIHQREQKLDEAIKWGGAKYSSI